MLLLKTSSIDERNSRATGNVTTKGNHGRYRLDTAKLSSDCSPLSYQFSPRMVMLEVWDSGSNSL